MIVPMKKATVLCVESGRDSALGCLRALGVLHLEPVRLAAGAAVEEAREELAYIRHAISILPPHPERPPSGGAPMEIVHALWKIIHERRALDEESEGLAREQQRLAPFGDFDPALVQALGGRGVRVRLFQSDAKAAAPVLPAGAIRVELQRTKFTVCFAVIDRGAGEVEGAKETPLPARRLAEVEARLAAAAARRRALEEEAARYGGDLAHVAALCAEAEDALRLAEARAGMGAAAGERIAYLRGYAPAESLPALREAAAAHGWGLRFEEPSSDDPVPTLIRTPRWIRPIESVFKIIGILPGYREVDVSLWFLVFFSVFFAMLVGDAGYGAIYLAGAFWARRRYPKAPPQIFTLLKITGTATIAWGVLTGSYFGLPVTPALFQPFQSPWLSGAGAEDHIKLLCFIIGAVHLSVAHVWNFIRTFPSGPAWAQLGWLGVVWFMYFGACAIVLGRAMPPLMTPVFVAGVVLVVLFMTPVRQLRSEWFNHVMLPLSLIGNFVDIVSYIRLYAVGAAGYAIASSFNTMLAPMFQHWPGALAGSVLLLLAHTVNILLSVMGVLVHGVRLNTLEFATHMGLQWSGLPYRPFAAVKTGAAAAGAAEH